MASSMLLNALSITNGYLIQNYSKSELSVIREEIKKVLGKNDYSVTAYKEMYSYEEVQEILSNINEKEDIRKAKGVYYTPTDIVKFILFNSVKMVCGKLKPNNLHVLDLNGIPYSSFCYEKTVYDPTCGAGVFLLAALEMKLDLLDLHHTEVTKGKIKKVVSTLKGNDLNPDSITITKIRLLLCVLHRHGTSKIKGLAEVMESCFESYDFVSTTPDESVKYDIIIGNPPYVEDSKSEATPTIKYGNIYANVLDNSAQHLKKGGVMGFIIPLSYVSTPRMKKIRDELSLQTAEQYILSYSDRPDCWLIENNFDNVRPSLADAEILDTKVTWQKFCETVNKLIVGNSAKMASAEDKRLGVYFIHENDLKFNDKVLPTGDYTKTIDELNALLKIESAEKLDAIREKRLEELREAILHNRLFPEKVIKYLWDDAFKFNHEALFDTETMDSLEKVIRTFVFNTGDDRLKVFRQSVRDSLKPNQN